MATPASWAKFLMNSMRISRGVRLHGLRTEMIVALMVVRDVYDEHEVILTSGIEGKHMRGSMHYQGGALDFSTSQLAPSDAKQIAKDIQKSLGFDFDVVLHEGASRHLHIEYDPKDPYS